MIDAPSILRTYLVAQPTLTALVGNRIWAELVYPPTGYRPSQGSAIVFRARGGDVDYSSALLRHSWQFKCYGQSEQAANAAYRALYDVLHDAQGSGILSAQLEIVGQTLTDPASAAPWPYVLCFYETTMLAQAV